MPAVVESVVGNFNIVFCIFTPLLEREKEEEQIHSFILLSPHQHRQGLIEEHILHPC
jgi:hypothetical protein